jgi:hypothetical protein
LDLLRDIDGLPLIAERRQDFNDASKEYVAGHQKKIEHQDSSKQAIEYGARPCEKCARYAKIAANRNDRTTARGSVCSLFGLLDYLLQSLDWHFYNIEVRFQARDALGQPLSPGRGRNR